MTWGEFKAVVDGAAGVTDDALVSYIDVSQDDFGVHDWTECIGVSVSRADGKLRVSS